MNKFDNHCIADFLKRKYLEQEERIPLSELFNWKTIAAEYAEHIEDFV